jgi:cobalt-precorrin 5A hydrolase / precorrin-3B C17-methyltransferase
MTPAIVILSSSQLPLALKIAQITNGNVHLKSGSNFDPNEIILIHSFEKTHDHLQFLFKKGTPIIAIMASGAVIRILAPLLNDKHKEPPVLVVSDDGSCVIPLLGGHHGANDFAKKISQAFEIPTNITTLSDVRFGIALDQPPEGFKLVNPENVKSIMARLLNGDKAKLIGSAPWLKNSKLPINDKGEIEFIISEKNHDLKPHQLHYAPINLAIGIGAERGVDNDHVIELVESVLRKNNLSPHAIAGFFSIDLKADEAAIHAASDHFNVPARFFDAQTLEAESERLENSSEIVFAEVGCHGVCEGAALAAVGKTGRLIVPKQKTSRATLAIAQSDDSLDVTSSGRTRGTLFVVGIGPGSDAWRSPEVTYMVQKATDLVAYSLYIDLLGPLAFGKNRHDFDLGGEEARVRFALELAGSGKTVALVCSGDAGIYAMATLVFELIERGGLSDAAKRVEIINSPGISALQGAAARAGAPLGHDFCTISLSDLLTPWHTIQNRVKAAAMGDFVIAFYNPVSQKRRTQLAYARDELLKHRPFDTPVILASNLGRAGEKIKIVPLGDLNINDVDMLTVVIVGSSQSRTIQTGDGKTWVYTPRGYCDKVGTGIEEIKI